MLNYFEFLDLQEAENLQRIEYEAKMRLRQEEFEENFRQQKAGFDSTILEIQQKYAQDLEHEQKGAAEKFATIHQQHNLQAATSEAAFRQQIFEAHQKISQAESRNSILEKENAQLVSTIEILRNDAARFQDARRTFRNQTTFQHTQPNVQHSSHAAPQITQCQAVPKNTVRNTSDELSTVSLRTTAAAEAASHRRRVTPAAEAADMSSDSELEDTKQLKTARKRKVGYKFQMYHVHL